MCTINLHHVVELIRARGVSAHVEGTGGNVATIYAGPAYDDENGEPRHAVLAGPGVIVGDGRAVADSSELCVGPDDDGDSDPTVAATVGARTDEALAELIVQHVEQTITPEQIADRVRVNLAMVGGRQGFLADAGGWLDLLLDDRPPTETLHRMARLAIALIEADAANHAAPETAQGAVETLRQEWGVADAYVFEPGSGTVHIPLADGSVFLADHDGHHPDLGAHLIGRRYDDGREVILWNDPRGSSMIGALGKMAEIARQLAETPEVTEVTAADLHGTRTAAVLDVRVEHTDGDRQADEDGKPYPVAPAATRTTVVETVTIEPMCSLACADSYLERTGGRHMPGCDRA